MTYDTESLLSEESAKGFIDNNIQVKNASAICIRTFKTLTYEMEKVVDVLINLIERKDAKSTDLKNLKRFKNDLEELKKYSIEELTVDKFQIDIKDIYKRIGTAIKDFKKTVIYTAERNECEKIVKTMKRIPSLTIDCFSAVNDYLQANEKEAKKILISGHKALESIKNKETSKDKVKKNLQEMYNKSGLSMWVYSTEPLSEEDFNFDQAMLNLYSGARTTGITAFNVLLHPLDTIFGTVKEGEKIKTGWFSSKPGTVVEKASIFSDLGDHINKLKTEWEKIDKDVADDGQKLKNFGAFLGSEPMMKTIGGAAVALGIFILMRKAIRKIKDFFRK